MSVIRHNFKDEMVHIRPTATGEYYKASQRLDGTYRCYRCKQVRENIEFRFFYGQTTANASYHHPICDGCRKEQRAQWERHPLATTKARAFLKELSVRSRVGAVNRGLVYAIDYDDALGLYVEQGGRCALSGVAMTVVKGSHRARAWTAASIDRIASSGNYTIDNIHLVCHAVNIMKHEMTVEQFGHWCKAVTLHALSLAPDRAGGE